MVTADDLATRREEIAGSADLQRLLERLLARAAPLLERMPTIPEDKALLSKDGGLCPRDGTPLVFDPWSPHAHRCPRCGERHAGERHDRHWARYQHLWLAERAAHLATVSVVGDHAAAGDRAREILAEYATRYLRYPNRDNVLGPSRLFFSTYLESLWVCNYIAAAVLLREAAQLDDAGVRGVNQLADEAANLIGEFDEGFSNRQTWNNAALAAIAVWFEDEDLAQRAIQGQTGLVAHLARGFGRDGLWYEGENYHLFALRAWLTGAGWARHAGVDLLEGPEAAARLAAALRAPAVTALPDFTYPARKDSRFGVSLAQPAYLELWEIGLAVQGKREGAGGTGELWSWLAALYGAPAAAQDLMESYLHDAPLDSRSTPHGRSDLSWWSLLEMTPELPTGVGPWTPRSELLPDQGLAVLRSSRRYASVECGPAGGGHGHFDRLNLMVHADGTYWLPDVGTASYVTRELFWYRSTLAHNAPRLDGRSQPFGNASCETFDDRGEWVWARGRYGEIARTVLSGPEYLIDVIDLTSREEHVIEVPWHLRGAEVETAGSWSGDVLADEFVAAVERFVPAQPGNVILQARADGAQLRAHFATAGELLRAEGPGRPRRPGEAGDGSRERFYLVRARGSGIRIVALLECVADSAVVKTVRVRGDVIEVETLRGMERHSVTPGEWTVERAGGAVRLAGRRAAEEPFQPLLQIDAPTKARGHALRISDAPALDGTLAGFDVSEPLLLEIEDQYRRSEEPYPGPDEVSAVAYVNWAEDALYVAVLVTKPELCFRAPDAPPLRLDNEPDDVHSDGLQLYLQEREEGDAIGLLIVPEGEARGGVRVHAVEGTAARPERVRGAWERTDQGYCVTLAIAFTEQARPHAGGQMSFDLIVNEMRTDRVRRAGQLVWSGGNGWIWLRGDRQSPERFGVLDLVG
jgi:hypothetical protein